jgi:predicted nucleotide-binding protein
MYGTNSTYAGRLIGMSSTPPAKKTRTRISQTDIPSVSLAHALRVPRAIADHYGKAATRPLDVAAALEMTPTSGPFRALCGAAIGYGLTEGGPNASEITLSPLGLRVVAPLSEGDDRAALRDAVLIPSVEKAFLTKYDGSPLPAEKIGCNVLESMGVPADSASRFFKLIMENAESVGFLKVIKDKTYVDLGQPSGVPTPTADVDADDAESDVLVEDPPPTPPSGSEVQATAPGGVRNRRVFVSHGKSRRVVDQLKELLTFGDFEPVVSVDRESVSKPVPQKVLDDMRACGAGIIHVKSEQRLLDAEGTEHQIVNQNVLIEIGAAMALYGEHFILLVEEGTTLPSNLQGLYEVRYVGDELGYEATMKVLKALNQFKSSTA